MLQVWVDNDHWIHVTDVKGHDMDPDTPGVEQNNATVTVTVLDLNNQVKGPFWPLTLNSDGSNGSYSAELPHTEADVSGTYNLRLDITLADGSKYQAFESLKMSDRTI